MNFQQLRIVRETVRRHFNLTEVANELYTAQSGVSKHLKDLEDELGVELFVRRGKRLLGLTEPGKQLLPIVERILLDTQNIKRLSEQFSQQDTGHLALATTHTQARYVLPVVVTRFKQTFPKVHLELRQCGPTEIVTLLRAGQVDIGIATEAVGGEADLVTFPFYQWQHALIVPDDHPLIDVQPLTLEVIADYPLITYHHGYTGRSRIDAAFARAGLTPDVVMSALDADVIKAYVELGLGVGIIAAPAYHPARDAGLRLLDAPSLFEINTTYLALRRGHYLRDYALRFITDCVPALSVEQIKAAVFPKVAIA
ncbi:CysB family HTH-type transcriptional regulator [uncultured Thiocystis sp.]|jgi:LysR family cys regulon transcriptional activator|uniref:CysB family HTH-type transcriptional regulator n=1 Tax=uncultured Thiocystis sp. TaxID=1202134 RepID=UPI0025DB6353|nr:CysB family HTH-type transcriptional regulator [uncultured Thiocystis sp.]